MGGIWFVTPGVVESLDYTPLIVPRWSTHPVVSQKSVQSTVRETLAGYSVIVPNMILSRQGGHTLIGYAFLCGIMLGVSLLLHRQISSPTAIRRISICPSFMAESEEAV